MYYIVYSTYMKCSNNHSLLQRNCQIKLFETIFVYGSEALISYVSGE